MESKVLFGTIMGFQTKDAKGGALVVKVEIPLSSVNAAYLVDIKGKNCKMDIHPDEGQRSLDMGHDDPDGLDFSEEETEDPEVDPDDEEEMDDNLEESSDDETEADDSAEDI